MVAIVEGAGLLTLLADRVTWLVDLDDRAPYDEDEPRTQVHRGEANLVSSNLPNSAGKPSHVHMPLLDLDRPYTEYDAEVLDEVFKDFTEQPSSKVLVVPSTTEGHCHLYLQFQVPEGEYMVKLMYLAVLGLIEPGYAVVSIRRGATFLRLPHIKKQPKKEGF